jgi:hypothetical protein
MMMLAIPAAARSVESIRASAVGFAVIDMVPHIAASETHQRSREFSVIAKKDFFNTIGAKRPFAE